MSELKVGSYVVVNNPSCLNYGLKGFVTEVFEDYVYPVNIEFDDESKEDNKYRESENLYLLSEVKVLQDADSADSEESEQGKKAPNIYERIDYIIKEIANLDTKIENKAYAVKNLKSAQNWLYREEFFKDVEDEQ